ncbi:selenium metabolism membrane protein YedE/FdhT [Paraburkholderia antibiotica]|uniref:Selenium metabolism membrane protein YedE/FdhT n=1 Tax=Paraburkholderia antibiotica TaxID=2728839 RepID=A0A7X9ZYB8_9BURK|nr:selenium metabolism membrane protein YedE/FdhT [Paraburkholderia antibiotica]NML31193.1 selenium metabolism membrane protein YedE/FdhT [Paraburkholderia antibiotica]
MTWSTFRHDYMVRFWAPLPAVITAGVLSALYFGLTGTFWAVTGEFTRWGGHALQMFGLHPEEWGYFRIIGLHGTPWTRVDGVMVLGMFAGSLAAALWANNVKLRLPRRKRRIAQALVGGAIAGFGARLAMGCNLAAFFTGIPQFSLHAWLFALATIVGSYFGTRVALLPFLRADVRLVRAASAGTVAPRAALARWQFRLGVAVFCVAVAASLELASSALKLGFAALFGIAFGILIERAQICFTSAFRDMWITGRTAMARAIVLGMAASAIGIFSYVQLGVEPKILWAGPNAIIGGVLFGFGIVVAGGCETGWMYRSMEGQVHYWFVGIGNIAGATVLAALWDRIGPPLALAWPKVNLLATFGPLGGLLVTYAGLVLAFLLLLWWEKAFVARRAQMAVQAESKGAF